jgi:hypothetical protein
MKTKNLMIVMLFGICVSTMACKKCQTCTYQSTEQEVCRDDYGSQQIYDAYIISLESNGYDCK